VDFCWGDSPIYHDDLSLEGEATGPMPDLSCDGSLSWTDVKPGDTITGSFTVENIGESNSRLEWIIDEYPEWDTWTFQPKFDRLTPEDDSMTVDVTVETPNEENKEFNGVIKVCAIGDPDDYCEIPVSLTTPRNKPYINTPFMQFLENHPHIFPLLRHLLGL